MNIIEKYEEKINGVLETFDRMIINGYILQLCNYRQFLFYLIQNNVKLIDFNRFSQEQTESLCGHIDKYISDNDVKLQNLVSVKLEKDELARKTFSEHPNREGLVAAFTVVELCNTMTVRPNKETKKLEIASRPTKCKHYYLYYSYDSSKTYDKLSLKTRGKSR